MAGDQVRDEVVEEFLRGAGRRAFADAADVDVLVGAWVDRVRACPQSWEDNRAGLAAVVALLRQRWEAERPCVLCNPGTPDEIRRREEASAAIDRLIVDDDEDLPPGVHRERDGFLVMERNGPPPNLDAYGPPIVIAPPPDEPAADVVAAFEAGEKGVTKRRRVSATAIRQALYDSLSPNFEIDSDGYDDAAVAVALLVEGTDHAR